MLYQAYLAWAGLELVSLKCGENLMMTDVLLNNLNTGEYFKVMF